MPDLDTLSWTKEQRAAALRNLRIPTGPPVITIFVRHSPDCKYKGDEFCKQCRCRKHLRWSSGGKQYRKKAGTRSWAEAEDKKRKLEDQLAGRTPAPEPGQDGGARTIREAIKEFLLEKEVAGVSYDTRKYQYEKELNKLADFAENRGAYTVPLITPSLLTNYRATWPARCPSTYTRHIMSIRLRTFLLFCYHRGWIDRAPKLSRIKITEPETQPLNEKEYKELLKHAEGKTRTLIQLMRWSGLAVRDAALLKRKDLLKNGNTYRIVRERQKTGADLYVPLPPKIGREVVAVANGNPEYVFWNRRGGEANHTEKAAAQRWGKKISAAFTAAGIVSEGNMISHRLRDTYAVDLLQKGVPLEHVSKLLGHKSVITTERHYAKWVKGRQDLLERVVSATWKK